MNQQQEKQLLKRGGFVQGKAGGYPSECSDCGKAVLGFSSWWLPSDGESDDHDCFRRQCALSHIDRYEDCEPCESCQGFGELVWAAEYEFGGEKTRPCPDCEGTGLISTET